MTGFAEEERDSMTGEEVMFVRKDVRDPPINMQVDSHGERGGGFYQDGWLTCVEQSAGT